MTSINSKNREIEIKWQFKTHLERYFCLCGIYVEKMAKKNQERHCLILNFAFFANSYILEWLISSLLFFRIMSTLTNQAILS